MFSSYLLNLYQFGGGDFEQLPLVRNFNPNTIVLQTFLGGRKERGVSEIGVIGNNGDASNLAATSRM